MACNFPYPRFGVVCGQIADKLLTSDTSGCGDRSITLLLSTDGMAVEFHPDCEAWADHLPQPDKEALLAAKRVLESEGPTLGRPLVVEGSRHANMKELRPGSTGRTEIRVLFAFDLERMPSSSWAATRATTGAVGTRRTSPSPTTASMSTRTASRSRRRPVAGGRADRRRARDDDEHEGLGEEGSCRAGAAERAAEIEDELRLAAGLTALREQAGLSQRDVARLLGVSQPRIAAIEKSRNVTIDVLEQYVDAVGEASSRSPFEGAT